MKYVFYILFSIIEYSSLFTLMLALFRFNIRLYIKEIILASVINSILAFGLTLLGMQGLAAIVQILSAYLCVVILFKEKYLKAIWIAVGGYIFFAIIQTGLLTLVNYYKLFDIKAVDPYALNTHVLQVATALIAYIISFTIIRNNNGISISFHRRLFTASRKLYMFTAAIIILFISSMVFLFFEYRVITYFIVVLIIAIISFMVILLLSHSQEKKQMEK